MFACNPVFLEGERVSGKKVTDLYCGAREVLENDARETAVTGSGTEKSAHKKSATWKPCHLLALSRVFLENERVSGKCYELFN